MGSLRDQQFLFYRYAQDRISVLFGSAFWAPLLSAIYFWTICSGIVFYFLFLFWFAPVSKKMKIGQIEELDFLKQPFLYSANGSKLTWKLLINLFPLLLVTSLYGLFCLPSCFAFGDGGTRLFTAGGRHAQIF
jgi:flagellar biosynthesis protein FlhB